MNFDIKAFIKAKLTAYQIDWNRSTEQYETGHDRVPVMNWDEADVVSSEMRNWPAKNRHLVCLDIDYPAYIVPSSTEGHHHLYLDVPGGVEHHGYMALIALLGHLKIIEPGYAIASIVRGHTDLRPPWVHKGHEPGRAVAAAAKERADGEPVESII